MLEEMSDWAQMYYTGSLIAVCKSEKMDPPNFSLSRRFIEDREGRSTVERPAEVVSRNVEMAPVCGRLPLPFAGEDAEREISMRIVEH